MWQSAIEGALEKIQRNIVRFGEEFPHVSTGGGPRYELSGNTDWTEGFWVGLLWLSYEYSGKTAFRTAAEQAVDRLRIRLEDHSSLEHHDIGFLYSLSAKAQWMVEHDESARQLALWAADILMKRWRPQMGILQAWGPEHDPVNGGRIIIDCMMNLPLLFWAAEQTGEARYREAALRHAAASRRFLVRGDGSSYHTFYFDRESGDALRGGTHQGYRDGSGWTRGQAWGIYGFALAHRYAPAEGYADTAKSLARYFLNRLPEDGIVYWDFDAPQEPGTPRDSSASAIAACGLLELAEGLPPGDPEAGEFHRAGLHLLEALVALCADGGPPEAEGLLRHGSYSIREGASPDDFMIWGDYFYLEGLLRAERGIPGYWYERPAGAAEQENWIRAAGRRRSETAEGGGEA